jgi:hypothetical protein
MPELISKAETGTKVTYVYRQDGQLTNTTVVVAKTSPPTWTVTPSATDLAGGKTWQTIVAAMDAAMLA